MRVIKILAIGLIILSCKKEKISIVVPTDANEAEMSAAHILQDYCEKLYENNSFEICSNPAGNLSVRIGLKNRFADSSRCPQSPEGFYIGHDSSSVTIMASGNRGLLYAVYAQLEKLGCGFYLSTETMPEKKKFNISEWEMTDSPVINRRIVFNWHNFLSGCTAWNYREWKEWVLQSSKMRFNTIMVHAYGNNPMYRFSYNGIKKESGYIATSARGRDWGTEHVNDVRNIWGGEVFNDSIFGADAAKADEKVKEDSAVALMQKVFDLAHEQQMDICFAFDIATNSSNPQDILKILPTSAVMKNIYGDLLADPDSPEGYAFYKSQVNGILNDYPQITLLAPWVRLHFPKSNGNYQTPAVFPDRWKKEYKSIINADKDLYENGFMQSVFYIGKVMKAYRRILVESGRNDIELCIGTWDWISFPFMDKFLPKDVTFIPIDWFVNFDSERALSYIRRIDSSRNLIPVVWAHHDDHKYIGKPYTPYENFTSLLQQRSAEGYGIIHWTTRPLDLYFKSLSRQVWENTRDEKLKVTTARMTQDIFGTDNNDLNGYLYSWITTAPMLGRETTDFFFDFHKTPHADTIHLDKKYDLADTAIALAEKRLGMLSKVNTSCLNADAKQWYSYYRGMEEFFISFFSDEQKLVKAYELCDAGKTDMASSIISKTYPEKTIQKYADFSNRVPITAGEKGVIIALNTKWLPDFLDIRQKTGQEPIRIRFYPTQHEPLAQGQGSYTLFAEKNHDLWLCLGEKETGLHTTAQGIESDTAFSVLLGRYRKNGQWVGHVTSFKDDSLAPGSYVVKLIIPDGLAGQKIKVRFVFSDKNSAGVSKEIGKNEYEIAFINKDKPLLIISPDGRAIIKAMTLSKIK